MTKPTPAVGPGVGVGAYLLRDGKVLMGLRTTGHASGVWAPPGGHVEFGESPAQTASREVAEETGLQVPANAWRLRAVTNDYFADNHTHYLTLALVANCSAGEPQVLEPHKLKEWRWFDIHKLPEPLMTSITNALKAGLDLSVTTGIVTNC